jgi:hypothetical protein
MFNASSRLSPLEKGAGGIEAEYKYEINSIRMADPLMK